MTDPETKRKAIGKTFIDLFQQEAKKLEWIERLGQGTIYSDVIESVSVHGKSSVIKSHHNVWWLPETLNLKLIEPLRLLFKDDVRRIGSELGIPQSILWRHPFPGPGLGIRILGQEVNERSVSLLQQADAIFVEWLRNWKTADGVSLYDQIWMAWAILLPVYSTWVMWDERTYEQVVALRVVNSTDVMTATVTDLPHAFWMSISKKIISEVKGINRVVLDISEKPPATMEWE